jgi:hypothetical protein
MQSGKDAKVGRETVKEGTTNRHTPDSDAPFVGFLVLFLYAFAALRLCVKSLPNGFG